MARGDILQLVVFSVFFGIGLAHIGDKGVLGGIGILFAFVGQLSDTYFDTITGLDFLTLGLVVNRP